MLSPLACCGLVPIPGATSRWRSLITAGTIVVAIAGLTVSAESAAVLGLVGGSGFAWWAWWRTGNSGAGPSAVRVVDMLVAGATILAALLYAGVTLSPHLSARLADAISPSLMSRTVLWRESIVMVRDYCFTGAGLATTGLILSSYLWLEHVPKDPHVHHLFLQVALEQGIPGLVALIGMIVAAAWSLWPVWRRRDPPRRFMAAASAAALAALVLYGLAEADVYDGATAFVIALPVGFALALGLERPPPAGNGREAPVRLRTVLVACLPLAATAVLGVWLGARAQLLANLGAVVQTRAELGTYRWPEWSIQDELRRNGAVDLEPAADLYRAALAGDPSNATANRRLGQIELSQGNYEEARRHLEAALVEAPGAGITRRLLGEVYAVSGDAPAAAGIWATSRTTPEALGLRLWWYRHIGADVEAARFKEALDLFQELFRVHADRR